MTSDILSAERLARFQAQADIWMGEMRWPDELREAVPLLLRHIRAIVGQIDRESGGRLVREVWIAWAKEQPNPKASWLVPWEGLEEPDKEVDRRIFEACAARQMTALASEDLASSDSALWQASERVLRVAGLAGVPEHEQDAARIVFGLKAQAREIAALRSALSDAVGMIDLNSDAFDADDYEKNKAEVERLTAIADGAPAALKTS